MKIWILKNKITGKIRNGKYYTKLRFAKSAMTNMYEKHRDNYILIEIELEKISEKEIKY